MTEFTWQDYWKTRTHGGHRRQTEEFLRMEAEEKLFHLKGGESILDFGCGSADLLVYYAQQYPSVTVIDFSASMLDSARRRSEAFRCTHIRFIQADNVSAWDHLEGTFDRISMAAVIQYLTLPEIDRMLEQFARFLS